MLLFSRLIFMIRIRIWVLTAKLLFSIYIIYWLNIICITFQSYIILRILIFELLLSYNVCIIRSNIWIRNILSIWLLCLYCIIWILMHYSPLLWEIIILIKIWCYLLNILNTWCNSNSIILIYRCLYNTWYTNWTIRHYFVYWLL